MATILDKRIINLSSQHGIKQNGSYNSNISFFFQNLLRPEKDIAYTEVGVVSCEIPVSFYIINDANNSFVVDLYSPSPTATKTIVLSNGNYNATTFITELKSKIQTAYAVENPTNIPLLQATLNRFNGKLSLSLPANGTFTELQIFDSALRRLMGFSPTVSVDLLQGANPVIATFPINLLGINKINIGSNNLATYNYDSASQGYSNILASIEVDAVPYGVILYKNQSLTYNILRVPELDTFSIELRDLDGNYIDFNNQDWTITLGLNIYRYMPQFSQTSFSDILGIKPPASNEIKKDEPIVKKDEPSIKNDMDLLTYQ